MKFHRRCGDRVTLLHDNTTAVRNFVEFNHGLILSAEPLPDDVIFEVCIDRKVNVWNGSLEIGVTTNDPEYMDLPATATKLRNTAWIMSGCSVVRDGVTLINEYGPELDSLHEGEILGVMKSSKGDLSFYVNGRCLGVAAEDIPERVFAVIDLYGQCVQVTIVSPNYRRLEDPSLDSISEAIGLMDTIQPLIVELPVPSTSHASPSALRQDLHIPIPSLEAGCSLEEGAGHQYNNDWQMRRNTRANSDSSGSGDPDQDVMSDRCTDDDSREDRYDSIARGIRDIHLDSNVVGTRNTEDTEERCRVGMLYDWHLDQLTPYTGDGATTSQLDNSLSEASEAGLTSVAHDKLRFHPRCGFLVKLSSNYRTAERSRPLDDYNNGVVMTHRPLRDNELFEIRIDKLVDKWSGSIEMGVTHHNPATIRYPSTMTNMESGTIMMSGCKVLLNGQGTCLEYGNMNLDELREGDRVGVVRKINGELHYLINGVDQGVAAERVQTPIWGVIDLYGMTVKVTIQDGSEADNNCSASEPPPAVAAGTDEPDTSAASCSRPRIDEESLLFHTLRDSHVTIINDGKTAHRPNAFEYFHNGVVTTNRTLRTNELFQVRLDLVIPKWAGSVEIGVTQHPSNDLKFPYRVSNTKTGTWVLAGEDVIQNSNVIIPKYVRNLSRLKEGDTVGVVRKDDGILHFYVNGVDQGPAACNVPENVYGIVDLYGRVAQATIVDAYRPPAVVPFSPESPASTESNATVYPEMCFHRVHGRNARLSRTRLTASRTAVYSEFNDAVLFSSRPLRECDMFELRIDAMVDCWIGSLEIGVTALRPEDLEANGSIGSLAGTATDLNYDTYILSGAAMMKDGECVKSGYPLDLDTITVGSRVGMMWHADRSLHYYLDGMDMGKAWYVPHLNIYAVVDLYGQCTQVTILQNEERAFNYNGRSNSDSLISSSRAPETPPPPYWSFSEYCGDNMSLTHDFTVAKRPRADPLGALVFSSAHLALGEIFEIKIVDCAYSYAGNLRMGVTDVNILNAHVNRHMPPSVNFMPHFTAYIDGRYMRYTRAGCGERDTSAVAASFEWLRAGDRVGFEKAADSRVMIYLNGELLDTCFENVPDKVYVVMELYGRTTKIQTISRGANVLPIVQSSNCNDDYRSTVQGDAMLDIFTFDNEENNDGNSSSQQPLRPEESDLVLDCEQIESTRRFVDVRADDDDSSLESDLVFENIIPLTDFGVSGVPLVYPELKNMVKKPFTFYKIYGNNLQLLSSDTVARRVRGYSHAVVMLSVPIRRGQSCSFRIDKINPEYRGTISIGGQPYLPVDPMPERGLDLTTPTWLLTSEYLFCENVIHAEGFSSKGLELEYLEAGNVVTVHFDNNGEVVVRVTENSDVNSRHTLLVAIGPCNHPQLYPFIDVYGRVTQVSVMIHEYDQTYLAIKKVGIINRAIESEPLIKRQQEKGSNSQRGGIYTRLHSLRRYNSTPTLRKSESVLTSASMLNLFSAVSYLDDEYIFEAGPSTAPANRRRLAIDAPDDDRLDTEIVTALTLEQHELPDLTDEKSVTSDDSPKYSQESLCSEHINYARKILYTNQEGGENASLEAEWESGDGCAHLRVVLSYWKAISQAYPELRGAVSWGQIKCYCEECEPNVISVYAGWVRIERIDGVGAASRGFWHVTKSMLARARSAAPGAARRPPALLAAPCADITAFDRWINDDLTYLITLAIEIDTEGSNPDTDRLLAILLYVRACEDSDATYTMVSGF
ncbi:neuralized-like protein 4 isoform X2 [Epargyreus clarus]|uniref:neuralized-like protein 4 isoform X2 n=1 Tax=Epargyreus clarus TaxID=520877 RepID=UPI003C2E37E5